MFSKSPLSYDAIYSAQGKDYEQEALKIGELVRQHKRSAGDILLDVGCGTGGHLLYLSRVFQVEGLDLDGGLLDVARRKLPNVALHQGDMVEFDLGRRFDVVTCLFGAIGYVRTVDRLRAAMGNLARHLLEGGVLIVEPWLTPLGYRQNVVHATFVDKLHLKIARINAAEIVDGNVSVLNFHYLVGTPGGVEHFTERHELGLFTHEEYMSAIEACGLSVAHDRLGLNGRGIYVGVAPA